MAVTTNKIGTIFYGANKLKSVAGACEIAQHAIDPATREQAISEAAHVGRNNQRALHRMILND